MEHDPLAQYRKTPPAPKGSMLQRGDEDGYVAFGTKDKVRRLRIHSGDTMTHSPGYNLLLDIVSDGRHGTTCILVYTIMLVKLRGKNLQKMVFAIENGMADFIQVFDAERWQKPADASVAMIDSIEVKIADTRNAETETEH